MANWTAENTNLTEQGAQVTERSENDRIALAESRGAFGDGSDEAGEVTAAGTGTSSVQATEYTENQRIATVAQDPDSQVAKNESAT